MNTEFTDLKLRKALSGKYSGTIDVAAGSD